MKSGPRYLLAAFLLCLPAALDAQGIGGAHELVRLAEGVYAVEPIFAGAAAAIVINEDAVLVVDTHGSPASARALIEDINKLTDRPIRYVVNTHWHVDHHAGNQAYYDAYPSGVEFISHHFTRQDIPTLGREQYTDTAPYRTGPIEAAKKQLGAGADDHGNQLTQEQKDQIGRFIQEQEAFVAEGDAFEFILPNVTFEKRLLIHADKRAIEVLYFFRGHTRGDVVVYLPKEKILVAGDLLTKPILWTWSSYPTDYVKTLRALERLDIEQIVVGHGGPVIEGKAYLTTAREAVETMIEFVEEAAGHGVDPEEAQARAKSDPGIQSFRRRFVEDNNQENQMFDRMVEWTIARAFAETRGEID